MTCPQPLLLHPPSFPLPPNTIPVATILAPHYSSVDSKVAQILYTPSTPSTQTIALENLKLLEHKAVVLADIQTKGTGRRGNEWKSDEGGMWSSIVWKEQQNNLQYAATVNLINTLKNIEKDLPIKIKWPNDIYARRGDRWDKIAGIKVDSVFQEGQGFLYVIGKPYIPLNYHVWITKQVLTGMGVNVFNTIEGGSNLADISRLSAKDVKAAFSFDKILSSLLTCWQSADIFEQLYELSLHVGSQVRVEDEQSSGIITGVTEQGLRVVFDTRTRYFDENYSLLINEEPMQLQLKSSS